MDAKHTPGPWRTKREGYSTVYVEARIGGGWIQEVAACGPTENGSDQQQANARLIAAAPELLEALVALHESTIAMNVTNSNLSSVFEAEAALAQASAAIAKATGEQ